MLRKEIARKAYEHKYNAATEDIRSFCKDYPMWRFYTNKDGTAAFRIWGLIQGEKESVSPLQPRLGFKVISAAPMTYEEFKFFDPKELYPVDRWNETQLKLISQDMNAQLFVDPCGYAMVTMRPKGMSHEEAELFNDFRKMDIKKDVEELPD